MRFEVGELVKLVVALDPCDFDVLGHVGTVTAITPESDENPGTFYDYEVDFPEDDDFIYLLMDFQLQKLNPPEEPVEMTHHEEVEA